MRQFLIIICTLSHLWFLCVQIYKVNKRTSFPVQKSSKRSQNTPNYIKVCMRERAWDSTLFFSYY